jgi:thiamine biosynthesis protein ThiS
MLVTDRTLCPRQGPGLPALVDAVAGSVDAVQVREKDLADADLLALARDLREVTRGRALLFVNGHADVALAAAADGVQLGEDAEPVEAVRRRVGDRLLIGRSVHTVEGALAAEEAGADLLVLGTIYPSRSHPGGATGGSDLVARVSRRTRLPVIGIGGITEANAGEVIRAGAAGIAVISAILTAAEPVRAAATLRAVVNAALQEHSGVSGMIRVTINGRPHEFERELGLPDVIARLAITHPRIAVAYNGTVLRGDEHASTVVRDGDRLEIVRMVGGG